MYSFYEFFAGGGMARLGLGSRWQCLLANDIDEKKAGSYAANWGDEHMLVKDIAEVSSKDLPGAADLIWASFPCQDLSLAGSGAGLAGERSGTFWPFWNIVKGLQSDGRKPNLIVLENVCGALSSHGGKDFCAIADTMANTDYRFGAVIMDAVNFVPQSRPRLFIVGINEELEVPESLQLESPVSYWHSNSLQSAYERLSPQTKEKWIWWNLAEPKPRNSVFADLIEDSPKSIAWHTPQETQRLLAMMSDVNIQKVRQAQASGERKVGTLYKRTRPDGNGGRVQRAEIRFDDTAGCLRTPGGGSSRQLIMLVEGDVVKSRLLSPRETARLMGLPDSYILPDKYNEAYHLTGDGLVVPVVSHLEKFLLTPLMQAQSSLKEAA